MKIERKIARRMAKAQMEKEGIQHPHKRFADLWKRYAAKRHMELSQSHIRKLAGEAKKGKASKPICIMDAFFARQRA